MPSLSGLHMCADDFERAFVAVIQFPEDLVGQAFLGEVLERLQTEFQGFTCDHGGSSLCYAALRISRTLLVNSGKNSRMSSTIPTSAT